MFRKGYFWNETFKTHYYFTSSKKQFAKMVNKIGYDSPINGEVGRCLFTLDKVGQNLHHEDELLPYLVEFIFKQCELLFKKDGVWEK